MTKPNLSWIDEFVRDYEIRVYGKEGAMSPRAKKVLRAMKMRDHEHWLREQTREDSHSPVGDWEGMREVSD